MGVEASAEGRGLAGSIVADVSPSKAWPRVIRCWLSSCVASGKLPPSPTSVSPSVPGTYACACVTGVPHALKEGVYSVPHPCWLCLGAQDPPPHPPSSPSLPSPSSSPRSSSSLTTLKKEEEEQCLKSLKPTQDPLYWLQPWRRPDPGSPWDVREGTVWNERPLALGPGDEERVMLRAWRGDREMNRKGQSGGGVQHQCPVSFISLSLVPEGEPCCLPHAVPVAAKHCWGDLARTPHSPSAPPLQPLRSPLDI